MSKYRVIWTIDLDADTPKEAALKALKIQRDPESIATCFDVCEEFSEEPRWSFDLEDESEDES